MIKIKSSEQYVTDNGVVIVCASDVGLSPGEWPPLIELDDKAFRKDAHSFDENDCLAAVTYVNGPRQVLIYND